MSFIRLHLQLHVFDLPLRVFVSIRLSSDTVYSTTVTIYSCKCIYCTVNANERVIGVLSTTCTVLGLGLVDRQAPQSVTLVHFKGLIFTNILANNSHE